MKKLRGLVVLWIFCVFAPAAVLGDTPINAWIKPGSGDWQDQTAWSLGVLPSANQTIMLTNQGWKAIAIRGSTAEEFPASLDVSSVTVSGNTDSFNVLLLNYAGTDVPLRAANGLSIGAGGQVQNLGSGLIVESGSLSVSNSDFIQVGGVVITTNAWLRLNNGNYYLTNGLLEAGQVNLGVNTSASFVQDGGYASMSGLRVGAIGYPGGGTSAYELVNGWLYVSGSLLLEAQSASAVFNHRGGTNFADVLQLAPPLAGAAVYYNLYGGMFTANSAFIDGDGNASYFNQTGGSAFITNTLALRGGTAHGTRAHESYYQLSGGNLTAGSLDVNGYSGYSIYTQSNGTARIAGNLYLGGGGYLGNVNLNGGMLACSNIYSSGAGDAFVQTGGSLIVSNMFSFGGLATPYGGAPSYVFNGGTLTANDMELYGDAHWSIGASAQAGRISNPGSFKISGATLHISDADEHLGRFILATKQIPRDPGFVVTSNSAIDLFGNNSRLSFADSSGQTWDPGTTLTIYNWSGNPSGGGGEQLKFGNSSSGLTPAQLSKITFLFGEPPVSYPAKLLNSGELVPDYGGSGTNSYVNAWTNPASGNWEDLKWSLGVRPGAGQTIMITNQGWKAVAIGPATVQNFPETLDVSKVITGGYTDSFNALLLNYAGYQTQLVTRSLIIGTNSGVTVLASQLFVPPGAATPEVSIGGAFNQGQSANVTCGLLDLGDIGPGSYNLTNGNLSVNTALRLLPTYPSVFNQFGGSNYLNHVKMEAGACNISGGSMTIGDYFYLNAGAGTFRQTGGLVTGRLSIANGAYELAGGTLSCPGWFLPSAEGPISVNARVLQTGGSNLCNGDLYIYYGRIVGPFGPGSYVLSNGVCQVAGKLTAMSGGDFQQWGGSLSCTSIVVMGTDDGPRGIHYSALKLGGGSMATAGVEIQYGGFVHSGGTNRVSGDILLGSPYGHTASYTLTGGRLEDQNTSILSGAPWYQPNSYDYIHFSQGGGYHSVSNLLTVSGEYGMGGGQLVVPEIRIDLGSINEVNRGQYVAFRHTGGTVSNLSRLTLAGGTWEEQTAGQQFGNLLLAGPAGGPSARLCFPTSGSACTIRFAGSSGVVWSNNTTLTIENWHGSESGGGASQLYFGSNASGLTPQQLSQVRFHLSNGLYAATILTTGEVVPVVPKLQFTRNGNNFTLNWAPGSTLQSATNARGPYLDVPGANSPWTVNMNKPTEFFRLRQ